MNAIAAPKSQITNAIEAFLLVAVTQGLPVFGAAALAIRLLSGRLIGAVHQDPLTPVLGMLFYALLLVVFAPRFPHRFERLHLQPFFDPTLSLARKFISWRDHPQTARVAVTMLLILSVLAIAGMSVR
jgi:hypothetical protein